MIHAKTPTTTTITSQYDLVHIVTQCLNGNWVTNVQLTESDENGNFIRSINKNYVGIEHNELWTIFDTWKNLVTKVVVDMGLDVTISADIETKFENKITN